MDYNARSDDELLRLAQAGDRSAIEAFCRRWHRRVFDMAWSIVRNRQRADDVTMDVFSSLQKRLQNPDPINFPGAYIKATVRNAAHAERWKATVEAATLGPLDHSGDVALPGMSIVDSGDGPEALETLQRLLAAIAETVSRRDADIAYLLAAGLRAAEVVEALDDVPDRNAVYKVKNLLKNSWEDVLATYETYTRAPEWAVRRWGRTLRKEAT